MAAVNITISGMLYDKLNKTQQNVALIGEAFLTDLAIGGGPIIPPDQPPTMPPGIEPPPPGTTKPIGPPTQVVQPIVTPDFIVVNYPGFGLVAVGKPVPEDSSGTTPPAGK